MKTVKMQDRVEWRRVVKVLRYRPAQVVDAVVSFGYRQVCQNTFMPAKRSAPKMPMPPPWHALQPGPENDRMIAAILAGQSGLKWETVGTIRDGKLTSFEVFGDGS